MERSTAHCPSCTRKSHNTYPFNEKIGKKKLKIPITKIKNTFKQINLINTQYILY